MVTQHTISRRLCKVAYSIPNVGDRLLSFLSLLSLFSLLSCLSSQFSRNSLWHHRPPTRRCANIRTASPPASSHTSYSATANNTNSINNRRSSSRRSSSSNVKMVCPMRCPTWRPIRRPIRRPLTIYLINEFVHRCRSCTPSRAPPRILSGRGRGALCRRLRRGWGRKTVNVQRTCVCVCVK